MKGRVLGRSLLLYTESRVIEVVEVVELESEMHSQQCFLNPHKYAETVSSGTA